MVPSQCLYADDIFIFCKGTTQNVRNIMQLFQDYVAYSGQIINTNKSKFYSGSIPLSRLHCIAEITGFRYGSIPFTYLGIPLFKGKPKSIHFRSIVDRIQIKLAAWKGKMLTIMGRVQLINVVISNMLVYSFHIIQMAY